MNIVFNGHSNYGVGIALGKGFTSLSQFFNMSGGGTASISSLHFGPEHLLLQLRQITGNYSPSIVSTRNSLVAVNPINRFLGGPRVLPGVRRFPLVGTPAPAIGSPSPPK